MPSAVQLAGRLQQKLGRLVALDGERGSAVSARAATFSALDALEGALERQPAGPFSAELSSALQRLVDPLLALVAQHRAAGDDPPNLLWAADAAASVLFTLLCCVDSRRLVLNDADALRLLSAAPVVLRVQPQMLRMFAESFRSGDLRAQDLSEDLHPCRMMETNVQAVSLLVSALTEPEPPLPERALAAAQATSLRPQALKDWLCGPGSVLDTIAAFLFVVGPEIVSDRLFGVVLSLLEEEPGVAPLMESDHLEQSSFLTLCTNVLSWAFHTGCSCEPPVNEPSFPTVAIPVCHATCHAALATGRQRLMRNSVTGDVSLLPVAVRATERLILALEHAPPAQHTQRPADGRQTSTEGQACCLEASLVLLATVWEDVADAFSADGADGSGTASHGASPAAASLVDCLPHLGTTLAAVHRLFGHVAAAGGSVAAGRPTTAMAAVASRAWRVLDWQEVMAGLAAALFNLSIAASSLKLASAEQAAAAASCAAAALRLAPLLPQLPLLGGGDAEAAAAVPAGTRWQPGLVEVEELLEVNPAQALAEAAQLLAQYLLLSLAGSLQDGSAAERARLATPAVARAAFEAASLACSYEWAAAAAKAHGGSAGTAEAGTGSASAAAGDRPPTGTAAFRAASEALHAGCLAALSAHAQLLSAGGGEDVQRRLDCLAALYMEALAARPEALWPPASQSCDSGMRCLAGLLSAPGGAPQLVSGCGGAAAVLRAAEALLGADLEEEEDFDFSCIAALLQAAQLCPAAVPLLAGSPTVLRALSSLAAVPLRKPEEFETLFELARLVAAALPQPTADGASPAGEAAAAAEGEAAAAPAASEAPAAAAAASRATAASMPQLAELLAAAAERCPLAAAAPAPEAALSPELAVQRGQALAARASCANPRCPNLAAPAKGKRCKGCGVARYCGEACSREAWRGHRPACRQWSLLRQQGAA